MTAAGRVDRPGADRSAEFVGRLMDDRYRFPIHESPVLGQWLASVLPACFSWPAGVLLRWDASADRACAAPAAWPGTFHPPTLRLSPGAHTKDGYLLQGVVAQWEGAGPAGAPLPPCWIAPPHDLFDALAMALAQRSAALTGTFPAPGLMTGMTLRRELADCLRRTEGQQLAIPQLASQRLSGQIPPHWLHGDAVSVISEMVAVIREDNPTLSPYVPVAPVQPGGLAAPLLQPLPQTDTLALALHTLREGGWCPALDHLIPTVLVRLPFGHPFRREGMRVNHGGHTTLYGRRLGSPYEVHLHRLQSGQLHLQLTTSTSSECPAGPDHFLEAALGFRPGLVKDSFPGIRGELATVIETNPQLMRMRLALFERHFPGDHEFLLRLCLVNGEVTAAGRQVLDPTLAQRPVERADMQRWYAPTASALQRSPEALAAQGISVINAHFLAAPLRPTVAGNILKGDPMNACPQLAQQDLPQLLVHTLPGLYYAYRNGFRLVAYLRTSESTLEARVSPEALKAARDFATAAAQAERLVMPQDGVPPASRSEPDASCA
ncbi:hypothetical protein CDN98_08725 [Roseateles terrae]|nr:hypothetical protein CDN98_08725 [Roseateles terrae]